MARGLKFGIKEVEGLYYLCSENKGAVQLHGMHCTAAQYVQLICAFVFAYSKGRFSHDTACNHLAIYTIIYIS